MKWLHKDLPPLKEANTTASAGKVMIMVLWASQGILFFNFLTEH
jgi:hypothetical protein